MKRFTFKLQAVLTLRQQAEQVALERYSRAIQSRQLAAERVLTAEQELSEARRQWLHALADGCPAARAAQMLSYCHALEATRQGLGESLSRADVELSQASQLMLLARQQREAVERYLARQRAEYDRLGRQEEQKLLDDLISQRAPMSFTGRSPDRPAWN